MSLKEVVLEIADEMEKHSKNLAPPVAEWVKQLKLVCKVACDAPSPQAAPINLNQEWYNKAKEEARENAKTAKRAIVEETIPKMIQVIGGDFDNDTSLHVPIDPATPVGAKTLVEGKVCILSQEGKLVYSESETKKYWNAHKPVEEKKYWDAHKPVEEKKIVLGS